MDKTSTTFVVLGLALSFGLGYLVGEDHAETIRLIAPPPASPCLTPGAIRKVVYDYAGGICKARAKASQKLIARQ